MTLAILHAVATSLAVALVALNPSPDPDPNFNPPNANPNPNSNPNPYPNPSFNPNPNPNPCPNPIPNTNPNPDPNSSPKPEPNPNPDPNQVALVAAYAGGVMDQWSKSRLTLVYATGGALPLAIFLLTVAHTWLNADDELVGRTAPVPLDMLMDQRTYGLSLKLKDGSGDRRNGAGKRGGLQISLTLSER